MKDMRVFKKPFFLSLMFLLSNPQLPSPIKLIPLILSKMYSPGSFRFFVFFVILCG